MDKSHELEQDSDGQIIQIESFTSLATASVSACFSVSWNRGISMATRRFRTGLICGVIAASGMLSIFASESGDEIKTPEGHQAASSKESDCSAHPLVSNSKTTEAIVRFEAKNSPRYTVQPGRYFPGQKRPEEEEKRLAVVCELLMKIKPEPAELLEYFSWMKRPDCPIRFRSW